MNNYFIYRLIFIEILEKLKNGKTKKLIFYGLVLLIMLKKIDGKLLSTELLLSQFKNRKNIKVLWTKVTQNYLWKKKT